MNACLSGENFKNDVHDSNYKAGTYNEFCLVLNRITEIKIVESVPIVIPYIFLKLGDLNSLAVGSFVVQ